MTILIFIIILAVLVLSHELGHFIFAKRVGIEVPEFGFGFPPKLFGKKIGETYYSVNLIPFGGFVRIKGEEGEDEGDEKSFASKPAWIRALILTGGVIFNILLAYVIFSFSAWYGAPEALEEGARAGFRDPKVMIFDISPGSPAQLSGLMPGDNIVSMNFENDKLVIDAGDPSSIDSIQKFTDIHAGSEIFISVMRGGKEMDLTATPRVSPPDGEGPLGIALLRIGIVSSPFYRAFWDGAKETYNSFVFTIGGFYRVISLALSGESMGLFVAGPIGIVSIVGTYSGFGFLFLIRLVALLSINLAVINLIPFPALDGGRLLFLGIEKIKGKPINPKTSRIINAFGLAVLLILMIVTTTYDIKRLF